jgi:hypothetical protein
MAASRKGPLTAAIAPVRPARNAFAVAAGVLMTTLSTAATMPANPETNAATVGKHVSSRMPSIAALELRTHALMEKFAGQHLPMCPGL